MYQAHQFFKRFVPTAARGSLLLIGLAAFGMSPVAEIGQRASAAAPAATQPAIGSAASELLQPLDPAAQRRPYEPTSRYVQKTMEGWTVRVSRQLADDNPELSAKALDLLNFQLYQIRREVPAPALAKLRQVCIWLEQADPLVTCMCYHPDGGWVRGHGLNPDKTHCVEIGSARRFLEWEHTQPWMVLHELAHAYHDQFLDQGFDNPSIAEAFESAKDAKLYDAVLRNNDRVERAYAMTNAMEYFAECSEAFFGTNDFYPFVRAELKEHDPKGYAALCKAWGTSRPEK